MPPAGTDTDIAQCGHYSFIEYSSTSNTGNKCLLSEEAPGITPGRGSYHAPG